MISLRGVKKSFDGNEVVHGIDLEIPAGEIFAFLGPNGAGKTTTIKMIVGLLQPGAGEVVVAGHPLATEGHDARGKMGYVPDEPYLYDKLSGREFLEFIAEMYGLTGEHRKNRMDHLTQMFDLNYLEAPCETYSHGMKQRVVIASAFMHEPRVLIVDEPLVGLDPLNAHRFKQLLKEAKEAGVSTFMSTHTLALAEEVADRVAVIHAGRILKIGSPSDIRAEDQNLEAAFLAMTADTDKEPAKAEA